MPRLFSPVGRIVSPAWALRKHISSFVSPCLLPFGAREQVSAFPLSGRSPSQNAFSPHPSRVPRSPRRSCACTRRATIRSYRPARLRYRHWLQRTGYRLLQRDPLRPASSRTSSSQTSAIHHPKSRHHHYNRRAQSMPPIPHFNQQHRSACRCSHNPYQQWCFPDAVQCW